MLLVVLSLPVGTTAVKTEGFTIQAGTYAEWQINSVTDQPVAWFRIDIWTPMGSWKAENGSQISYTVTAVTDDVYGDLLIGNLTITNSSSAEIASNLVLGILFWGPGLITHTNWTTHTEEAQDQARSEWINGTLTITERTHTYMDTTFETITFDLVASSQNTTLIYEKHSGILMEAQTGFGAYFLDIVISSTDPPLKGVEGPFLPLTWPTIVIPLLVLVGVNIRKRRKSGIL